MIVDLFQTQVKKTPANIAIAFEGRNWTYQELDVKSNQLANYLREQYGAGPDVLIGIRLENSDSMILSMLAVIKSGSAFVPIDPQFPVERVRFIIEETQLKVLLTDSVHLFDLGEVSCPLFALDIQLEGLTNPVSGIEHKPSGTDLMYVIYTSGTTGNPKGVMIEHRSFENYITCFIESFNIAETDSTILLNSYAFDLGYTNIWGSLLTGGKLHLISGKPGQDPDKLVSYIEDNKITYLKTTPSLFYMLTHCVEFLKRKSLKVRLILLGGEALRYEDIELFHKKYPGTVFENEYGPTEGTVGMIMEIITPEDIKSGMQIIGSPAKNTEAFIMNKNTKILPVGIVGEICIGGSCLARGYLKNEELTSEKFLLNPYRPGKYLYKTGDLGKWLPDGRIVYLGRQDDQVKIKGFRIELEEINKALQSHMHIEDAITVTLDDKHGMKYLTGYYISGMELAVEELKAFLGKKLPEYMIPVYLIPLDKFPLTANGKVDKKALPNPENIKIQKVYVEASNAVEQILQSVWEDVLGRKQISVTDGFFSIGGDSIKAIQIASRMYRLNYKVEVKDIFQYTTIKELAQVIETLEHATDQSLVSGEVPLTPIQLKFFNSKTRNKNHYNQSVMLSAKKNDQFEEEAIKKVFAVIIEHHDALRTTFENHDQNIIQFIHGREYPVYLEVHNLVAEENPERILNSKVNELQKSIDLQTGPLIKVGLYHLPDGDRLLIVVHHLVMDGISFRILLEDFQFLLKQLNEGKPLALSHKTDSFKTWSEKLREYSNSKYFLKEKEYWRILETTDIQRIPEDFVNNELSSKSFALAYFELDENETECLLTKVHAAFHTEINDILLSALSVSINRVFGIAKFLIALEGHGRENILPEVNIGRTIGWFTSIYPVLLDVSEKSSLSEIIKEIKETLHGVPHKGIGYNILKYLTTRENKSDLQFADEPQLTFNYLGQFDADTNGSSFEVAKEGKGNSTGSEEERNYDIEISAWIVNKRFELSIAYNRDQYKVETMNRLCAELQTALRDIISYCGSRNQPEFTPSDYFYKKLSIDQVDKLNEQYKIEDIYPLSPMQSGMLFHSLYEASSSSYFVQLSYRLHGSLNSDFVEKSLNVLVQRYSILRTAFLHEGFQYPIQLVLQDRKADFYFEDITKRGGAKDKNELVTQVTLWDKLRSFNLSNDPLFRVVLVKISENEYEFIWSLHHILLDGWCTSILIGEYSEIYNSYLEDRPYRLAPVKNYHDTYLSWLARLDKGSSKDYWRNYLDGYEATAEIPKTKSSDFDEVEKYEAISLEFDRQKTFALRTIAARNNATLNTLCQALWGSLLAIYNDVNDIVFGAVVSGRPAEIEGVESIVGLFINTIPVRLHINDDASFADLIAEMQRNAIASEKHHYFSLAEITSNTELKGNLFDHILVFDNYPLADKIESLNQTDGKYESPFSISKIDIFDHSHYDLAISASDRDQLFFKFDFNKNVYSKDTIEKVVEHFSRIADQVIKDSKIKLKDVNILSGKEQNQLLHEFNNTSTLYPDNITLHQLFEVQVRKSPNALALIFEDRKFSYEELNSKANRLSRNLRRKFGIQPNDLIGLMADRSSEMIIAILAILKSGAAYVPIDPAYPEERINYMLEDSGVKVLLIDTPDYSSQVEANRIFLKDCLEDGENESSENLGVTSHATDLAYVIYTSGSTGKPQGSQITHRSVVNLTSWLSSLIYKKHAEPLVAMLTASVSFDASVQQLFSPLVNGSALVVVKDYVKKNPILYVEALLANKVDVIDITPSYLNVILNTIHEGALKPGIRYTLVGGEPLNTELCQLYNNTLSGSTLFNVYGLTETTVNSTCELVVNPRISNSNIGRPISNTRIYILGKNMQLLPLGITGELYIGGVGVGKGYLNKKRLTAERFIKDPFSQDNLLYKTGDLARWLPDGSIEYLGRKDQQVKIRGYRIELDEIENVLRSYAHLKNTAVAVKENANKEKYIVAYYTASAEIQITTLKSVLLEHLPHYMIPSRYVRLDVIPLTPSGKVNWKALPDPENEEMKSQFMAPRNEVEEKLASIWQIVLRKTSIGIHDNFFDVGGHSLTAMQVVTHVYKTFNVRLEIKSLFSNPTIAELASVIDAVCWLKELEVVGDKTETEEIIL